MTEEDRAAVIQGTDERYEVPDAGGFACLPGLVVATGTVQLRSTVPGTNGSTVVLWTHVVGVDDARSVYEWMCARPGCWQLWGRLVQLFGDDALYRDGTKSRSPADVDD